ncbi:uncharacterized protein LOC129590861 [Paramacrobiotus metropolitanus]|uniref:uncharacterized protein LOC129590861 n=1 Tax=Paramacrobiotus metropolitanus TaxID=2943436 RepID=UPI0024461CFD|nr:uncharacterized protein LOC129590861 [Paramacrobiotus metropolitanus]
MKEVLMVAEKPNLATALSNILSRGNLQRMHIDKRLSRGLPLFEWDGPWPHTHEMVRYKMTSTYGHVKEIAFEPEFDDWRKDPDGLFSCGTFKRECNPESRVAQQLKTAGRGIDYLVLWLDCDKEGENICFEVMDIVSPVMKSFPHEQRIFRARFSALTESDVMDAFSNLRSPNRNESLSVDARMELDLRIGCAFTRFQTRYFIRKYGKETLKTTTIPFGPCQTPTLAFCVNRHNEIVEFRGECYYKIEANVDVPGSGTLPLKWKKGRTFDRCEADDIVRKLQSRRILQVMDVTAEEKRKLRPVALNTVQLLRMASSYLKISPSEVMETAERLYMDGFISYPRTETTQYPASFDRLSSLSNLKGNNEFSSTIDQLMYDMPDTRRTGKDVGDHPPIIPLKSANGRLMQNERSYNLYQMICKHFLASLSSDCLYLEKTAVFDVDGEKFVLDGIEVLRNGFTDIHQHQRIRDKLIPNIRTGSSVGVSACSVREDMTTPPDYLTESDLIQLMEQHGIGTDASIPAHIQNIFKRNFVQLNAERKIIPTPMGLALIQGYRALDEDLVKPQMRSTIERDLSLIAQGSVKKEDVVKHVIEIYRAKYQYLTSNINVLDAEIALLPLIEEFLRKPQSTGSMPPSGFVATKIPDRPRREFPVINKRKMPLHVSPIKKRRHQSPEDGRNANEVPVGNPPVLPSATPAEGSLTQRLMALASASKPIAPIRADFPERPDRTIRPEICSPVQPPKTLSVDKITKPVFGKASFGQNRSEPDRTGILPSPALLRCPLDHKFDNKTAVVTRCCDMDAPTALAASFAPHPQQKTLSPIAMISPRRNVPAGNTVEPTQTMTPTILPSAQSHSRHSVPQLPLIPSRTMVSEPTPNRDTINRDHEQTTNPSANIRLPPAELSQIDVTRSKLATSVSSKPPQLSQVTPVVQCGYSTETIPKTVIDFIVPSTPVEPLLGIPVSNAEQAPSEPLVIIKQEPQTEYPGQTSSVASVPSQPRDFSSDSCIAEYRSYGFVSHQSIAIKTEVSDPYWTASVKQEPLDNSWSVPNSSSSAGFMRNFVSKVRSDIMAEFARPVAAVQGQSHKAQLPVGRALFAAVSANVGGDVRQSDPESSSISCCVEQSSSSRCYQTVETDHISESFRQTTQHSAPPLLKNFSTKGKTPVQAVYEYCQKVKFNPPTFDCIAIGSKSPEFSCKLNVNGSEYGPLSAANKKDAMKNVARYFLTKLGFALD